MTHLRSHDVATDFPLTLEELDAYDVVILSDVGANTRLLPPFAANWIVPLTSVRQPTRDMGETAARLLIDHVTHPGHEHQRVVLEPALVVRRSSGCYEE
ncbi:substrate-binding domain-containing protein [Tessaracoccus sp. MC1865]|nr:substrate-binding domain-containing protein [Tessaracoccus sp. MC1865]